MRIHSDLPPVPAGLASLEGSQATSAPSNPVAQGGAEPALGDKVRVLQANQQVYETLKEVAEGERTQATPRTRSPHVAAGGSKKPLNPAEKTARTVKSPKSQFVATVQKNFSRWDLNKDGSLDHDEIQNNVIKPRFKGKDAAALAELDMLSEEEGFKSFGARDLKHTEAQVRAGKTEADDLMRFYAAKISDFKKQKTLFGKDGEPAVGDITQGMQGDCYLLSALTSKVQRDPQSIKDMITPQADGTYSVRFKDREVTVPLPTDTQLARSASSDGQGRWVEVVERAYAEYVNQGAAEADRQIDPYDIIGAGGLVQEAMEDLGAKGPVQQFLVNPNPDARANQAGGLRESLTTSIAEGKWINALSFESPAGLPTGHAYTVLGFDANQDLIHVRNPWGYVSGGEVNKNLVADLGDGQFNMRTHDFMDNFQYVLTG